jgi:CRP/FNR family cyclic AMP-dependent transcriptional regulator
VLLIEKNEMICVLHGEHDLSERFIADMLVRNIRVEEDLIDQLFNSSEKRLARALVLLARYGEQGRPQKMLPKVSQEMLAEMIGTTRPGSIISSTNSGNWASSSTAAGCEGCKSASPF